MKISILRVLDFVYKPQSNFSVKCDKHPADYCVIFYGSEVISVFNFAVGACALRGQLGSMTNILDTLYKICLHPRPDDEFINRFSKVIDVYSIAEKSELVDSLARFIAEKFLSGEGSFEETDVAINNLAGYAICNNRIPEFMWGVYMAFDDAELGSDGQQRLPSNLRHALGPAA